MLPNHQLLGREKQVASFPLLSIWRYYPPSGPWERASTAEDGLFRAVILEDTRTLNRRCLLFVADDDDGNEATEVLSNHFIHPASVLKQISSLTVAFWVQEYLHEADAPNQSGKFPTPEDVCIQLKFKSEDDLKRFTERYHALQELMAKLHEDTKNVWSQRRELTDEDKEREQARSSYAHRIVTPSKPVAVSSSKQPIETNGSTLKMESSAKFTPSLLPSQPLKSSTPGNLATPAASVVPKASLEAPVPGGNPQTSGGGFSSSEGLFGKVPVSTFGDSASLRAVAEAGSPVPPIVSSGVSAADPTPATGLFGSTSNATKSATASGGGLFTFEAIKGTGLFGGAQSDPSIKGAGLFAAPESSVRVSGLSSGPESLGNRAELFSGGSLKSTTIASSVTNENFSAAEPLTRTGGLSGAAEPIAQTTGMFGTLTPASGGVEPTSNTKIGGQFGAIEPSAKTGGLFGSVESNVSAKNSGLFGSLEPPAKTGGFFGANTSGAGGVPAKPGSESKANLSKPANTDVSSTGGPFSFGGFAATISAGPNSNGADKRSDKPGPPGETPAAPVRKASLGAETPVTMPSFTATALAPGSGLMARRDSSGNSGTFPNQAEKGLFAFPASPQLRPKPFSPPQKDSATPPAPPSLNIGSSAPGTSNKTPGGAKDVPVTLESVLRRFYEKFEPSKIDEVPKLAAKYQGKESQVWERLKTKYPACVGDEQFEGFFSKASSSSSVAVGVDVTPQQQTPFSASNNWSSNLGSGLQSANTQTPGAGVGWGMGAATPVTFGQPKILASGSLGTRLGISSPPPSSGPASFGNFSSTTTTTQMGSGGFGSFASSGNGGGFGGLAAGNTTIFGQTSSNGTDFK